MLKAFAQSGVSPTRAALTAVLLAGAAALLLALLPFGVATEAGSVGVKEPGSVGMNEGRSGERVVKRESLLSHQGPGVLVPLTVPVVLASVGLWACAGRKRIPLWGTAVMLGLFCLIGIASIGLYYAPASVALLVAAARSSEQQRDR